MVPIPDTYKILVVLWFSEPASRTGTLLVGISDVTDVLLMSMIGSSIPAPQLREIQWESEEMKIDAFAQVRQILVQMYKQCNLVHGDLSEFNLLYHSSTVYVIDLAQAMDLSHPSSLRFLHRDISIFFIFFVGPHHKIPTWS
ncbi:unnamed protein product [Meloidogyne enterolobii]|uniref:Uncharacterized protein n=1 Tax=Meloidogyne enterolobii TaxID=390850 RepID=A0ACB0Y5V9_MELEN